MTTIATGSRQGRTSRRTITRLNDRLAWAILLVLFLAPLPRASVLPFFYVALTILIAGAALLYFFNVMRSGSELRHPINRLRLEAALVLTVLAWLLVQTLPLGGLMGEISFPSRDGIPIRSESLSIASGPTWLMLLRQLGYALFFFLVLQVCINKDRRRLVLNGISLLLALHAAYSLIALTQLADSGLFVEKVHYLGSATGTFVNRNSFATFLSIGACVSTALLAQTWVASRGSVEGEPLRPVTGSDLLLRSFALAITLVALVATQSRMGVLAGGLGVIVVAALGISRLTSGRRSAGVAVAAMLVIGALVVVTVYGGGLLDRLGSLESSSGIREALYQQVWTIIGQRPWLGFGGGSFELAYPIYQREPVNSDLVWDNAHSTYLTLWFELGIVLGTIPMLVVALLTLRVCRNFLQSRQDWGPSAAALGATIACALHALFDFSLEIPAVTLLFLAVLAAGVASSPRDAQSRDDIAPSGPSQPPTKAGAGSELRAFRGE